MLPPFDLDTAARTGTGQARLLAFFVAMAIRDGADRVTLGSDPTPGVNAAELSYDVAGVKYLLVPPPVAVLPKVVWLCRLLADPEGGFPIHLRGHQAIGRLKVESTPSGDSVTIDLPVFQSTSKEVAVDFLDGHFCENGLVYFDDKDFL